MMDPATLAKWYQNKLGESRALQCRIGAHAQEAGLPAAEFCRRIRRQTGKTPRRHRDERRKVYVLERVAAEKVHAYDLAVEIGLSDEKSFCRWVKAAFGMSFSQLTRQLCRNARKK